MKISRILFLAVALLPIPVQAQVDAGPQNFELFENLNDSPNNSASSVQNGRNTPNNRGNSRNTQANPVFTLVGTSRIGSSTSVLLKHLNGDVVRVPVLAENNTVPGHELYTVVESDPGRVSIRHPASIPCADFPDQGVSCDSTTNISVLSLTTAEAIVSVADAEPIPDSQPAEEAESATEETTSSRNPFAALRERNREAVSTQATSTTRFQPRRIAPEDVPPGMRVVSTPFGDRLVQQ